MDASDAPQLVVDYSPNERRVYWLNRMKRELTDGRQILLEPEPELLAVAIAKCSRSGSRFDQNVFDTTLAKAASFHEKWVVGFGHGSVAEHAFASVALENISQVAIKVVEDCRLASFTETSSRYQVFSADRNYFPRTIKESPLAQEYLDYLRELYETYYLVLERVKPLMLERHPRLPDQKEAAYAQVIKAHSCDVARYLLPSAALAQFGVTMNAREWCRAIIKLLSSQHEEAHEIGQELIRVLHGGPEMDDETAIKEKPLRTLLKYANRSEYEAISPDRLAQLATKVLEGAPETEPQATSECRVVMLRDDDQAEVTVAAALLAKNGHAPFARYMQALRKGTAGITPAAVIAQALETRGAHEAPLREFEHARFMHEIVIDYGAWRDIQRHRILSPINQTLDASLGYDMPAEVAEIGLEREYRAAMEKSAAMHTKLCQHGLVAEAEYVITMGYRRRIMVSWDLRELFHFIELRSGAKGHPSYRRIAQRVWHTLNSTHPEIARHIRVDLSENTVSTLGAKPKGI